jgi:hypothetical protein
VKQDLVPIEKIVVDKRFYPRMKPSWFLINKYSKAKEAGADLPPIDVADVNGKLILIDGMHRMKAFSNQKEKYIQARIHTNLSDKEIFALAVKLNSQHGAGLSVYEITQAIIKLRDMKMNDMEISKIVSVPISKLESFVGKRLVYDSTLDREVVLKKPFRHLKENENVSLIGIEEKQESFAATSQTQLIDELIIILENDYLDYGDKKIMKKLERLAELLNDKTKR